MEGIGHHDLVPTHAFEDVKLTDPQAQSYKGQDCEHVDLEDFIG